MKGRGARLDTEVTMARQQVVVSAMGPDRVGLVEQLAGVLTERGANIEDSNMAAFCGEFAIIMLVTVAEESLDALLSQRAALEQRTGLSVTFKRPAGKPSEIATTPYLLEASCLDHPGLVHRLTRVAADAGINIEAMETRTGSAPWSGAPMFRFEARLAVPADQDVLQLQARFQRLAEEKNIEVRLKPAT